MSATKNEPRADRFRPSTAGRAAHLKDETDFVAAASAGTLPLVSFVKPDGLDNEHPNYTDVITGGALVFDRAYMYMTSCTHGVA